MIKYPDQHRNLIKVAHNIKLSQESQKINIILYWLFLIFQNTSRCTFWCILDVPYNLMNIFVLKMSECLMFNLLHHFSYKALVLELAVCIKNVLLIHSGIYLK